MADDFIRKGNLEIDTEGRPCKDTGKIYMARRAPEETSPADTFILHL